jgi:hypothetical protein
MSVGDKKNPFHLITSVFLRNIKWFYYIVIKNLKDLLFH